MNRGLRTAIVLAVALVAALGASFVAFMAMQRLSAQSSTPDTVPVVVAVRDVPMGTLLTTDHVKVMPWPTNSQVQGALGRVEDALDRGTILGLAVNEPVTEAKLAAKGIGSGLSPTITPGMRAISIKVNEVVGVAGFVVPGSRVDVLVTIETPGATTRSSMTRVVVSNVQVLTAGTRIDQDKAQAEGKPIAASVVTLLVLPEDAERIALAQVEGQVTLTLRNPTDTAPTPTPGARLASLLGTQTDNAPSAPTAPAPRVRPRRLVAPPPAAPPAPKAYTVETIRGAKRTEEIVK
ncbi:Flp pilus assembly protein CpaB [Luteitalea pratensis]|uniref:Flp pilus assembly protein CpaB n=1 Tax=Luteitalea pratensis TaxID=1855912 RepID=A0A143PUC9_LUTPR|nr:Flp pilus assembly protein CpaB [Luteitalea pratensis]AMY12265.1 Flp pilus assembly protein CpaB [Luteitalea pratensis]